MGFEKLKKQPNIIMIITDQQTWIQNWDPEWADKELPAMKRLMANGLTFNRAHCNSCTCSPSRATLFSGTYPAHHKVNEVLGFDDPQSTEQTMQNILSSNYQNMGKMMEAAGYHVEYKGKWHLTKPALYLNNTENIRNPKNKIDNLYWTPVDTEHIANKWRFNGWNYPDAGDDMQMFNFGGGNVNNDGRFVDGDGDSAWYEDSIPDALREKASVLEFLKTYKEKHGDKPFFLVVSLVNPHDVLSYPGTAASEEHDIDPKDFIDDSGRFVKNFMKDGTPLYKAAGYKDADFEHIKVKLPVSLHESLDTKPYVQTVWKKMCQGNGPIQTEEKARKYIQFYAYLTSLVDKEINKVLHALDENNLTDDSLIVRISDHGDMGMAHGMQRQKMYNVYRETLNVPMIFSNPKLYPEPLETDSLSGLIDLMPTLATVAGVEKHHWKFQGKDLTPVLLNPRDEVQQYVHFTYDDTYLTTKNPADMGPSHIRCIVSKRWKYAVYFDPHYGQKAQYEMYDLVNDKAEMNNLAWEEGSGEPQRQFLHEELTRIMNELGTMPDGVIWPKISGEDIWATQPDPVQENMI